MSRAICCALPLILAACAPAGSDDTEAAAPAPDAVSANNPTPDDAVDATPTPAHRAVLKGRYDAAANRALYGPARSESILTIACTEANGGAAIAVYWARPADPDRIQNLDFLGDKRNALVRISSVETSMGTGYAWQGRFTSGDPMVEALETPQRITVRPQTGASLEIDSANAGRVVSRCLAAP